MPAPPSLAPFVVARSRIAPHVVRTPIVRMGAPGDGGSARGRGANGVVEGRLADADLSGPLWLKLESLQVTGSFKARGALNKILGLPEEVARRGIVTASGGNHGLAVAYAGWVAGVATSVYLPRLTPDAKAARIAAWGATVHRAGEVWDDAHAVATARAEADGQTYVHPFADQEVIHGQGTLALELAEQAPEIDLLVIAVGGGGLLAGVASAAAAALPGARVVGVEPTGAPTLYESLREDRVVELPSIATRAGTLAPRRSAPLNLAIVQRHVESICLVTDQEMADAARWLFHGAHVGVELSGAAAVAALRTGKVDLRGARNPCALVCGAGTDAVD